MKRLLAALLLFSTPALAHESFCRTPEMLAVDVMKVPTAKELITLRSIDIGFDELADVVVYGDGSGNYIAVAFIGGCYEGYQMMNDETVAAFIEDNTKRAEPL